MRCVKAASEQLCNVGAKVGESSWVDDRKQTESKFLGNRLMRLSLIQ